MPFALRLAFAVLLVLAGIGAAAQERSAEEHEVKAAYLLKFPAFVEWPQSPGTEQPFTFVVMGAERVAAELRALAYGRRINGRPVVVREVQAGDAFFGADLLFVGREAVGRLPQVAGRLEGEPVLIVSESADALQAGSVLNFVLRDGRVRFEVSLAAAEARGLRISSRLLALATAVMPGRL